MEDLEEDGPLCEWQWAYYAVDTARSDDARSSFELGDVMLKLTKPARKQRKGNAGSFISLLVATVLRSCFSQKVSRETSSCFLL
jgi:hypothetical protein